MAMNLTNNIMLMVCLVAASVSFVASLTLLLWVWTLSKPLAGKLLARELWHIALADMLTALLLIPWFVVGLLNAYSDFGNDSQSQITMDAICWVSYLNNVPFMTSLFLEVHIALATVFSIFRLSSAISLLSKLLPLVWACGFVIGGIVVWRGHATWDPKGPTMTGSCKGLPEGEMLKICTMIGGLAICTATYMVGIATGARARHIGQAVEGRAWRKAKLFVAAALVAWLPFAILHFTPVFEEHGVWFYSAAALLSANGFFNAAVYSWKSGFVRRVERRNTASWRRANVKDPLARDASHPPPQSFNVQFEADVEEVDVPNLTVNANRRAEREIRALERSGGFLACFDEFDISPPASDVSSRASFVSGGST